MGEIQTQALRITSLALHRRDYPAIPRVRVPFGRINQDNSA